LVISKARLRVRPFIVTTVTRKVVPPVWLRRGSMVGVRRGMSAHGIDELVSRGCRAVVEAEFAVAADVSMGAQTGMKQRVDCVGGGVRGGHLGCLQRRVAFVNLP